ncbi:MAG TPA: hypothetical protein VLO00_06875 [Cryobacterium sp.]|nr:hypothetical protein [Cryobacterium sp.]
MSNTDRGDGAEQFDTNRNNPDQNKPNQNNPNQNNPEQDNTNPNTPTPADQRKVPGGRTPEEAADQLSRTFAQESHLRILRSKAAVARSDVDALAAMHLDPDTLEDLLATATPREAERLRKSEHEISVRVAHARAKAEAAEAEYEQAVLDDFDEAER